MEVEEATTSSGTLVRNIGSARAFRKRGRIGGQGSPSPPPAAAAAAAAAAPIAAAAAAGKRPKIETIPDDFLDFLPPEKSQATAPAPDEAAGTSSAQRSASISKACRQFWKAGDYEGSAEKTSSVGMDHVRVHPKFLHSNATSHKWALGAIAELLDNAVDEVANGATYINVDLLKNPIDKTPMMLFEDNGGGMTHNRMRECMSFGYSEKSKSANTIGQYGNGFKTSTMRLGADVIVFSKSPAKDGKKATKSVGLLSYTFLVETGQQDIMVPMLDYEEDEAGVIQIIRGTAEDWARNVKTITTWSPFRTEELLRGQLKKIKGQGTRIIIFNLWEDDQKQLELDFESDVHDIQVRGVRDQQNVDLATTYPSGRHYWLYRHSLRMYASILYLRLPKDFKIMLREEQVVPHNMASDLMHIQELTYKPQGVLEGLPTKDVYAIVTLGFVKDAADHIDVQGFNVYHKNRLIKPFWRIWNTASSQGRGVVGILEANFVEPAHDKQGFEKTTVLQRLETRLQTMQKDYWKKFSYKVGYQGAPPKKRAYEEDYAYSSKRTRRAPRSARKTSPSLIDSEYEQEEGEEAEAEEEEKDEDEEEERVTVRPRKSPARKDHDVDEAPPARPRRSPARFAKEEDRTPRRKSPARRAKFSARKSAPSAAAAAAAAGTPATPATPATTATATTGRTETAETDKDEVVETPANFTRSAARQAASNQPNPLLGLRSPTLEVSDLQEIAAANNILNSRLDKLEETDAARLLAESARRKELEAELEQQVARTKELEAEITRMEDELQGVHVDLLKERDALKVELEEERKQREIDDVEIRRQLKAALQRVRELDAENKALKNA